MTPTMTPTPVSADRLLARARPAPADAATLTHQLGDGRLLPPAIIGVKLTCLASAVELALTAEGVPALLLAPDGDAAPVLVELPTRPLHRDELVGQLARAQADDAGVVIISLHRSGRAHTITGRFGR